MTVSHALRGTICSAGIVLGLMAPVVTASAAPASSWTAVARNGRGVDFIGHGLTARDAASRAMFACQHSRLTAVPGAATSSPTTRAEPGSAQPASP